MQLFEKWRPRRLADVVGQPKVLAEIETLRKHGGLSGRAYWITGKPGTGKTTIARCLAAELDPMGMNTFEAGRPDCSWSTFGLSELDQFRHCIRFRPMGSTSWVLIVNEAHGMGKELCRRLNQFLDGLPDYVTVIFTTTLEAGGLFEDAHATGDSRMLLQRCTELTLTTQGLAAAFAGRLHEIAKAEGLNGQPAERYVEWFKRHKGTCMREALEALRHTRSEPIFRAALDAARADVRAAALFRSTPVSILRARDDGVLIVVEEALSSLPLFDPARAGDGEAETAERPMIAGA